MSRHYRTADPHLLFYAGRSSMLRDQRMAAAREATGKLRSMRVEQAREWNWDMLRRLRGDYPL